MRVLLDTHTIFWAAQNSPRLSTKARYFLDESEEIMVSAASAFEIATKVRLSRWAEAQDLDVYFSERMQEAGYRMLPIAIEVALRAGRMQGTHGDPFDRIIAAQALTLDVPVISIDKELEKFGVKRIW